MCRAMLQTAYSCWRSSCTHSKALQALGQCQHQILCALGSCIEEADVPWQKKRCLKYVAPSTQGLALLLAGIGGKTKQTIPARRFLLYNIHLFASLGWTWKTFDTVDPRDDHLTHNCIAWQILEIQVLHKPSGHLFPADRTDVWHTEGEIVSSHWQLLQ